MFDRFNTDFCEIALFNRIISSFWHIVRLSIFLPWSRAIWTPTCPEDFKFEHSHDRFSLSMPIKLTVLLTALIFCAPCSLMAKDKDEDVNDVVLVPLLRGFANNQIVGLKEVMALGRVLGIKVAMQGIIESTHEHRPPTSEGKKTVHYSARIVPFGDLFDDTIMSNESNKLTTIDAMIEEGWDRKLGMVIHYGSKGSDKVWLTRWGDAYGVQVLSGPVQKMEGGFRCRDPEEMEALKASITRHKFVGIR